MEDFVRNITILKAIEITILSMGIVFFILGILTIILNFFKFIKIKEKIEENNLVEKKKIETKKFTEQDIKDENMKIAMMIASIEFSENYKNYKVRIKNVREIN